MGVVSRFAWLSCYLMIAIRDGCLRRLVGEPGPPHSFSQGRRSLARLRQGFAIGPGWIYVLTGARFGLPRRLRFLFRTAQACLGLPLCSSPAGRISGRLTFSFTASGGILGSSLLGSQSASSRIIAHATTAILRASAIPAFLRRVFEPPWIRVNVNLLQAL